MDNSDALTAEELKRLEQGDDTALAELFSQHRERLWRMVNFRIDRRLSGRVDADDILQEAYLDAAQRVHHYLEDTSKSFFVWLRLVVSQTMIDVHRRHLGAQMRDINREVSMHRPAYTQATSVCLAAQLLGSMTSPSQAVQKAEMARLLEESLEGMDPIDQEVLALRHFEELTNSEVAEVLSIQQKAASIRYVRAIARLKDVLKRVPGFFDTQGTTDG
ncbi:MAG: RNA polymerase subunit sigma-24 [Planctomycetaceae bacterium]|nr:RNA polymerase subunit sigma-24 [Planctomycetaceae bacterium]